MMQLRAVLRTILLLAGACSVLMLITWFAIASSEAIQSGRPVAYVAGACLIVGAALLIAYSAPGKLSKARAIILVLILAIAITWLSLHRGDQIDRPALARAAAIVLGILLVARAWLFWRRKQSRLGT